MNPLAYLEMSVEQSTHWWFNARREILNRIIEGMRLPSQPRILEVGCGTGGNLAMLIEHGKVFAFEMNATARDICKENFGSRLEVVAGRCPDDIPYGDETFDLICMFDVLEHIDEDIETLAALKSRLRAGGALLITVPAYRWLWSAHDTFLHHKRRYTAGSLKKVFRDANLTVERISYFNTLLFPLACLARLKDKVLSSKKSSGSAVPSAFINALFFRVFRSERHLITKLNLPFGVSLLSIVRAA